MTDFDKQHTQSPLGKGSSVLPDQTQFLVTVNTDPDKTHFFQPKLLTFFLFLHENIQFVCSNEYHNICVHGEIRNTVNVLEFCTSKFLTK